jgi:hypothetical protein
LSKTRRINQIIVNLLNHILHLILMLLNLFKVCMEKISFKLIVEISIQLLWMPMEICILGVVELHLIIKDNVGMVILTMLSMQRKY